MHEDINNIRFTPPQNNGSNFRSGGMYNGSFYQGNTAAFQPPVRKKHTVRNIIIISLVAVMLLAVIGAVIGAVICSETSSGPYIGVLYIEGEIKSSSAENDTYQQSWLLAEIDSLMLDDSNKGLLLYVNSPGGSVTPSDELYLKVMEYKETTERPVYAYFADTAASGAYYISAGADKIFANRNCTTGSIGVYLGPLINASDLLQKVGISADIIKSAENKAMGNSYEPLTEEQRAIYQEYVNEFYERFVSIVADGRNMSIAEVKKIADGRIYTATQAKANGLIDEIASLEEAEEKMLEETELEECDYIDLRYVPKNTIYTLLGEAKSAGTSSAELELATSILKGEMKPELMYKMS